jgi:hypothetical protein
MAVLQAYHHHQAMTRPFRASASCLVLVVVGGCASVAPAEPVTFQLSELYG